MTIQFNNNTDTITASGGSGALVGFPVNGFKNRIINGALMLDQRNNGASVTPTADAQYTLDRWRARDAVASKFSVQQNAGSVTPPTGFKNYIGVTSLSAYSVGSTDYFGIEQVIEGFNASDLGWGAVGAATVTLSFWVRSSLTGTFSLNINNNGGRSYPATYTINSANTWEQKTITVAGDTSGTWLTSNGYGIGVWFNLGMGSTYNGTANTWGGGSALSVAGSTSVVGTNGATFYITGVQLEKGSAATSFDYRPYGTELALCQRYYETGFFSYENGVSGNSQSTYSFQVLKRTTSPTVSFTNVNAPASGTQSVFQVGQSQFAMKNASALTPIYWNANWTATNEL